MRRVLALGLVWLGLTAATPLPLTPPPPDLARLVPFAAAPLDKPALVADAKIPPASIELPPLPLAAITLPAAEKPSAPTQSPRTLPCIGAWTGVASESLECGRARYQKGEYEDAVRALESAARPGSEREIATEARYWLGETYYRLGRFEQADWLFRQVGQDLRQEWGPWALHSSGWTALRIDDAARARDAFTTLLARPVPVPLDVWGRFGLGLASYATGRHEDALTAFGLVLQRGGPAGLSRDVIFWQAEAFGRTGDASRAADGLKRFVDGGPHPLLATAQLRLAWWTMVAGRNADAVTAFRRYLASAPAGGERDWGEAGLTLALLGTGDWTAARDAAAPLGARKLAPRDAVASASGAGRGRLVHAGRHRTDRPGAAGRRPHAGDARLGPAGQGRGRSDPWQSRRGAHAVRAGPHGGRRNAPGRRRRAFAWPASTTSCANTRRR